MHAHAERTVDVAALNFRFVTIPPGSFQMGTDSSRSSDQGPRHRVVIRRPFELQTTELTQAQTTCRSNRCRGTTWRSSSAG